MTRSSRASLPPGFGLPAAGAAGPSSPDYRDVDKLPPRPDRLRHVPPGVLLLGAVAAMLVVTWIGVAERIERDRAQSERAVEREVATLARLFGEHALRAVQAADQLARSVKADVEEKSLRIDIPATVIDPAGADLMLQVGVADHTGLVVASNLAGGGNVGANIRDREHFRVHVDHDSGEPFVSKPLLGRVSQRWSIQVSRRLNRPDGSFAGVVVVSMDPHYFTRFYQQVDLGRRGAVALVGRDGVIRARSVGQKSEGMGESIAAGKPFALATAERAPASGIVRDAGPSPIDGVVRISAYDRVPQYPLLVLVGRDEDEAMAEYRAWRQGYLTTAGLLSLLALVLALFVWRSVSRLERTTTALGVARAEAESASRMKSQFLASMSHELRTPLQSLLGFAEIIKRQTKEPPTAKFAAQIYESGERLRRTLGDVLDMAKVEAGTMPVRLEPQPLRPLLEAIAAEYRPLAERKGLAFALAVDPGVPARLRTDAALLARVLGNLVDNAIKFTERGSVAISAHPVAGGVRIEIDDTGAGIAPELQALLFEKFHRGDDARARQLAGTGLGLALARELLGLLGGRIAVASNAGAGSSFRVTLPAAAA